MHTGNNQQLESLIFNSLAELEEKEKLPIFTHVLAVEVGQTLKENSPKKPKEEKETIPDLPPYQAELRRKLIKQVHGQTDKSKSYYYPSYKEAATGLKNLGQYMIDNAPYLAKQFNKPRPKGFKTTEDYIKYWAEAFKKAEEMQEIRIQALKAARMRGLRTATEIGYKFEKKKPIDLTSINWKRLGEVLKGSARHAVEKYPDNELYKRARSFRLNRSIYQGLKTFLHSPEAVKAMGFWWDEQLVAPSTNQTNPSAASGARFIDSEMEIASSSNAFSSASTTNSSLA